ncbi:MAG: dehydrogenase [Pseudomonadota bacterium]|nr:dehydrogenase [Pseudomonadota bacterium]
MSETTQVPRFFRRANDVRKVRSKAPLRLGLAGGGTDVSPYSEEFGGSVLNATIDMYAYCTVEVLPDDRVEFIAKDLDRRFEADLAVNYPPEGPLMLHKAVYNRIVRDHTNGRPLPLRITTYSDAPPGSGLGTSSTMVVSIVAALRELLKLPLGEYDLAHLAYEIEREDVQLAGGKQDQYAAAFGGFNFMEFFGDRVIINPLRIRENIVNELHARMLLYFTGNSRDSGSIIKDQVLAVREQGGKSVDSMHEIKRIAYEMKDRLLKNDVAGVTRLFSESWNAKKKMANSISNTHIDEVAERALASGAEAVKISGAGGGGFMMILVDPETKFEVIRALTPLASQSSRDYFVKFAFVAEGVRSWAL